MIKTINKIAREIDELSERNLETNYYMHINWEINMVQAHKGRETKTIYVGETFGSTVEEVLEWLKGE